MSERRSFTKEQKNPYSGKPNLRGCLQPATNTKLPKVYFIGGIMPLNRRISMDYRVSYRIDPGVKALQEKNEKGLNNTYPIPFN